MTPSHQRIDEILSMRSTDSRRGDMDALAICIKAQRNALEAAQAHIARLEASLAYKQTMLDGCESEIRHREEIYKVQRTQITILENQLREAQAALSAIPSGRVLEGITPEEQVRIDAYRKTASDQ